MYQLKTNPYSTTGFRWRYINELEVGMFYENKQGDRFLVLNGTCKVMFKLDNPYKFCDDHIKYELRLLPTGEEVTFVQTDPIPF